MDFDFTTETITPDNTGIITMGGVQGLEIPASTTGNRPSSPTLGIVRINSDTPTAAYLEYWNGTTWLTADGTVTAVSVATANGLAGTVATSTTTPVITLSTTVTGVLTGNGSAISAATSSTSFPGYAAGVAGGAAGELHYQTAANTTGFTAAGTSGYTLVSGGTGAPTWTNAPTIVGTNISSIPNSALSNSSITVTGGTGLGVTGSPVSLGGTITLSNTGVTSVAGTAGNVTASGSTGAVTLNLATAGTAGTYGAVTTDTFGRVTSGTVIAPLANGGTNSANTGSNGSVVYNNGTQLVNSTVGASGYVLTSAGAAAPTWTAGNVTIGTTNIALGGTSTTLAGVTSITLTSAASNVTGVGAPVNGSDAVPLSYLQQVLAGLEWKDNAQAATTANLTSTYSNGTAGVGATLTNSGTQAAFSVDGYTDILGDRILVKNQTAALQNGIYVITTLGTASTNWVLTRVADANTSSSMNNATLYVTSGSTNGGSAWSQTAANPTIGTTSITFVQTAGTGGSAVTSFQTSLSGLSPASATGGAVTLSGTLGLSSGGTSASLTAVNGGVVYSGATAMAISAAGTANQLLQSNGASAPTWTSSPTISGANITAGTVSNSALTSSSITVTGGTGLTVTGSPVALGGTLTLSNSGVTSNVAGTGISVSGATGAVTIANTGVLSFSAGTTGLTPSTTTTGAVTLGGTLAIANGGTGLSTAPTNGQLLIGNGTGYSLATLAVSGSSIYVTNAAGTITIAGPKYWAESTTAPTTAPSATGTAAIATGTGSVASKYGQVASASGFFSGGAAGDAQNSVYMLRNITTTATPAVAYLDGASLALTLPTSSAYMFDADIVAYSTAGTTANGAWNIKGLIVNTAGTAAIVGFTSKTFIAGTNLTSASVSATGVGATLQFNVTGNASTTIRWLVTCRTTEITAS